MLPILGKHFEIDAAFASEGSVTCIIRRDVTPGRVTNWLKVIEPL